MTDEPDYTTLSGAEFQRAVGVDPAKWAAACCQRVQAEARRHGQPSVPIDQDALAEWFRDAMDAARAEGQRLARIGEGK